IHARAAIDFATVTRGARGSAQHKTPGNSPADTGFNPQTGQILDPEKFRKWQKEQAQKRAQETSTQPAIVEVYFKARNDLSCWCDLEKNRQLILTGDMEAVRHEPSIRGFMHAHQRFGDVMLHKLWHHLEFMIENRRKYFFALAR